MILLSKNDLKLMKELVYYCEDMKINKSKVARDLRISPTTVRNIMNKIKGLEL